MTKMTKFTLAAVVSVTLGAGAPRAGAEDWPMWGRTPDRRMNAKETGVPTDWDVEAGKNIKWVAQLGSQSYGNPIISGGLVILGTNNGENADASRLIILDEKTGKQLYQRVSPKLAAGRVNDWPYQGVCSTACVEGDLLWYCTPRCEVVCLDLEPTKRNGSAPREVWVVDMMKEAGVFPHNMTACSTFVYKDWIYVITGNGVEDTHKIIPAPKAPSVICFEKKTGKMVWSDNSPGNGILHGQYASPAFAEANGVPLVICPLGDGWIYAYDCRDGKLVWKFDSNLKATTYPTTRNELIATPVVVGNLMYIANGQDPEHGEGPGHLWCIDITKTGDVSAELPAEAESAPPPKPGEELLDSVSAAGRSRKGRPNPNSAVVWSFERLPIAEKLAKEGKRVKSTQRMNRTISTVAVADGMLFVPDFSGIFHCLDAKTGEHLWLYNMNSAVWGSPLVADGKVYQCTENGDVMIFPLARKLDEDAIVMHNMGSASYCSPVFANGTLYIMTRDKLYAIGEKK